MALPKPSGDFVWVQESWGAALSCAPLADVAPHVFSTRDLVLEHSGEDGAQPGWAALARSVGATADTLVRMRQVHCAGVFAVDPTTVMSGRDNWPEADIAVGADPGAVLTVRVADCVPILIGDRRSGAVAAVHAGWRGTAAGAVKTAVGALEAHYGSRASGSDCRRRSQYRAVLL